MPRLPRARLLATLSVAVLACGDARPPPYTRVESRAPPGWSQTGPVLAVFWATWCPPCVEELPSLRTLALEPPAGVEIVTYAQDEEAARIHEFFGGGAPPRELGLVHDRGHAMAGRFGVDELPAAFLVVEGRLVARFSGPRDWSSRGMRRLLARLVGEAASDGPPGARSAR